MTLTEDHIFWLDVSMRSVRNKRQTMSADCLVNRAFRLMWSSLGTDCRMDFSFVLALMIFGISMVTSEWSMAIIS